jgi:hypothetical protein
MSAPDHLASKIFSNVVGSTVTSAKTALAGFTNVTWTDSNGKSIPNPLGNWLVSDQEPADDIGRSEPTDIAINLTITPPPLRKAMIE